MSYALIAIVGIALLVIASGLRVVPQKQVLIIERLGKFHARAEAGINFIVPFLDSVRARHDLREQITKIEPQSVITKDNVTMEVDAVIYSLIADPVRATYEVANLAWGIDQLTLSALRNVVGALDLDHTLTSRDTINSQLRTALDCSHAAVGNQDRPGRTQERDSPRGDSPHDGEANDGGAEPPRGGHHR